MFEAFFIGLLVLLLGLAFVFAGYQFFRVLIPIFGFIAGFAWGAEIVSTGLNEGFLSTALGWTFGLIVGLLMAGLAYFIYALEVGIFFGFMGFWIVGSLLLALGLPGGFFTTFVATLVGIAAGIYAVYLRAPKGVLVFLSAFGGASLVVAGLLIMFGQVPVGILGTGLIANIIGQSFWWSLAWIALGVAGIYSQLNVSRALEYDDSVTTYTPPAGYVGTKGGKSKATKDIDEDESHDHKKSKDDTKKS